MDRAAILQRLIEFFSDHADTNLVAAWLFGSFGRGDDRPGSDVDVAVLYRRAPAATFNALPLRLEEETERLLQRTTQVVVLNRASVDLRARVLRDGVLVLDRDRSVRIRFEIRTRNEWFDILPMLREYRRLQRPTS